MPSISLLLSKQLRAKSQGICLMVGSRNARVFQSFMLKHPYKTTTAMIILKNKKRGSLWSDSASEEVHVAKPNRKERTSLS